MMVDWRGDDAGHVVPAGRWPMSNTPRDGSPDDALARRYASQLHVHCPGQEQPAVHRARLRLLASRDWASRRLAHCELHSDSTVELANMIVRIASTWCFSMRCGRVLAAAELVGRLGVLLPAMDDLEGGDDRG